MGIGDRVNKATHAATSRVDDETGAVAARLAGVISLAVRVLRWPTLALLVVPLPFTVATLAVAAGLDGWLRVIGLTVGVLLALVSAAFGGRRHRILRAVDEPAALGTELGIAVSLSGRVAETRGALTQIAGGGGWRVFSRLAGLWRGVSMTGNWIDEIGDLPRARYFLPPKIGTTVTVTVAALWLVPISIVVTLLTIIAALAQAL